MFWSISQNSGQICMKPSEVGLTFRDNLRGKSFRLNVLVNISAILGFACSEVGLTDDRNEGQQPHVLKN